MVDKSTSLRRAIVVCALGYFVDVFDLQLLPVLRVPSLTALGVPPDQLLSVGGFILNVQMFGMVLGGFIWGWFGDRFGRLRALYGSILIYSFGTMACGVVQDSTTFAALRFVTGFGLAGEVGAAVTLIAEFMAPQKRGWGITIIGGVGFLGPVFAVLTAYILDWRQAYLFAGVMGLMLLVLRMRLAEPALFQKIRPTKSLSDFSKLLLRPKSFSALCFCLLTALPFAYAWNLLNFFSVELGRMVLQPNAAFNQKTCLIVFYLGTSSGDVLSGLATQYLRSRRKAMAATLAVGSLTAAGYLFLGPYLRFSLPVLYSIYFVLGLASGCWALVTMMTAEHFGTNVRATSSLVMLNLLRGCTIPIVFAFQSLRGSLGVINAAAVIGLALYILAFFALSKIRETHGLDLDYVERLEKPALKA